MRVLVIGAGGFIGRHIVSRLTDAGHEVVCAGRSPQMLARMFPSHETMRCDLTGDRVSDWGPRMSNVDAVINASGIFAEAGGNSFETVHISGPKALLDACAEAAIPRLIHISALGADAGARSRFHLTKREADDHMAALATAKGFTGWTVLRPSLVVGRGGHSTALLSALAVGPMPLRIGPGAWQSQPIHVTDLAETIARLLETDKPLPPKLDVVGPQSLTTDALMTTLRNWLGLRPMPFFPVPTPLLRLAARAGDRLKAGFLTSENLGMFERGNIGDGSAAAEVTGWHPRPLALALEANPAAEADLWQARLFFLRPALRVGLALIWIITGIVSAVVYPMADSVAMVAPLGLTGWLGPASVLAGAAVDLTLGGALLLNWRPVLTGTLQIAVMLAYTVLATYAMPELWAHPFGALLKNIAVLLATLVMIALEAKR